jgi:hypothetical protein
MLLTWLRVGVVFMLEMRAILTPFATMLPAALTRLMALAFCSALPARATLYMLVLVTWELSTATLLAEADLTLSAPWTVLTTWELSMSLIDSLLDFCRFRLATVLVVELWVWFSLKLDAELLALLLAWFALAVRAAFSVKVWEAVRLCVPFALAVRLREALLVELLALEPLDALADWFAAPEVVELLVPLLAGLLKLETSFALEVPELPAVADSEVPARLAAPLRLPVWVDAAVKFPAADFDAVAFRLSLLVDAEV